MRIFEIEVSMDGKQDRHLEKALMENGIDSDDKVISITVLKADCQVGFKPLDPDTGRFIEPPLYHRLLVIAKGV